MRQTIPVAPAQVEAGNTSEELLIEIRQIVLSLYQATLLKKKQVTKKYIII